MNTKSRKKHKGDYCTTQPENGNAEVFVLPPNLLEKLGIKLDNIVSADAIPTNRKLSTDLVDRTSLSNHSDSNEYFRNAKDLSNGNNESSILETASLMRESVFLSPTFVPTVANVISGEVEIARPDDPQRYNGSDENEYKKSESIPVYTILKDNEMLCNNLEVAKEVQNNVFKSKLVNDSIEGEYFKTENICVLEKENLKKAGGNASPKQSKNDNKCVFKDDTIKSQTCSLDGPQIVSENKNVAQLPNCLPELEIDEIVPKKKKIEIINEEHIDITKFYKRKSINSNLNNNVFTPVSISMLLPTARKNIEVFGSKKIEETKSSDEVVSLLNNVGRVDTDIRKSKKFDDLVASDVVKHVNVVCFDNEANLINGYDNKKKLIDVITTVDNHLELGHNLTIVNKVFSDSNYKENKFENGYDLHYSIEEKIKESESNNFPIDDIEINSNPNMDFVEVSVYHDDLVDIDNISTEFIYDCGSENIGKLDLRSESQEEVLNSSLKPSIDESPVHLETALESFPENTKEHETKTCSIYAQDPWENISNENVSSAEPVEENVVLTEVLSDSNHHEKEMKHSNVVLRKSKSSIQGVEKPGGKVIELEFDKPKKENSAKLINQEMINQKQTINEFPESSQSGEKSASFEERISSGVLKTYQRAKHLNKNNAKESFSHLTVFDKSACDSYTMYENNEPADEFNVVSKTHDFCLCGDFGQLKYYEYDNSYEHIHFWKHKDVATDRDLIFSIYNVDSLCNYDDNINKAVELTNENAEEFVDKICWNEIYSDVDFSLNNLDDSKEIASSENKDVIVTPFKPIPPPNQANLDTNYIDDCEISHKINSTSKIPDVEQNMPGSDADKNRSTKVKDRSDIIYNSCLELTKSKEHHPLPKGDEGNLEHKESPNIQGSDMTPLTKGKQKRKASVSATECESSTDMEEPCCKKDVKCGVCSQILAQAEWEQHSYKKHGLIAWKAGETIDFGSKDLIAKVKQMLKKDKVLKCRFCNVKLTKYKRYMIHVQDCLKAASLSSENKKMRTRKSRTINESVTEMDLKNVVNCGVCKKDVKSSDWLVHICHEHFYLAWKNEEPPLDLDDEDSVEKHLCNIIQDHGPIICSMCGFDRKYGVKKVKKYMQHMKTCEKIKNTPVKEEIVLKEEETTREENVNSHTEQEISTNVNTPVECGVCGLGVSEESWFDHIGKEHNYLAWKRGEETLNVDDDDQVWKHLYAITKKLDGLICSKCGLKRKYVKKYISHIKQCDGTSFTDDGTLMTSINESQVSDLNETSQMDETIQQYKCGVCYKNIASQDWFYHIGRKHNYVAWKDDEPPLKIKEELEMENHLNMVMSEHGHLPCPKCGLDHKLEVDTVKTYLSHVENCGNIVELKIEVKYEPTESSDNNIVKCGVCEKNVKESSWIKHIESKHNYLAWKEGETPLDLDDTESIRLYLFTIIDEVKTFKCSKCGIQKKYPKSFITHLANCNAEQNEINIHESSSGTCECAVCHATVPAKEWRQHAMNEHYNIAWKVGDFPIDLKSNYGTEKYLKEYKLKKGKLVCKLCGISRVSPVGFYAHILTCGKTEQELEEFQLLCDVCNNKYLCIYKNQHAAYHREQEYANERKLKALDVVKTEPETPTGRRKAAVRASNVIERLNSSDEFTTHTCPTCGFDTVSEKKLARHKCTPATFEEHSNSDESDDSIDSKDNDLSEQENIDTSRRRKNKESMVQAKVPNVPFKYNDAISYIEQSKEDFYKVHFTNETLFPQWLKSEFELLSDEQVTQYLPELEQSCQIKLSKECIEWKTFSRFEATQYDQGFCLFVGASIQSVSWAPPHVDDDDDQTINYLAVSCHQGSDCPRLSYDQLYTHPGLIQIWDFGNFHKDVPDFVMGIAHDYGTVWAMEWCPSGAREIIMKAKSMEWSRLGLLAVACSDGLVYILSVPHPNTISPSGAYIKLKAVAMLKMTMGSQRKVYQASAITWSKQKGHTFVGVGYADGTTAYYDLSNTSPLLQGTENGITVFYPYNDERNHNVCVTDMDTFPPARAADAGVAGAAWQGAASSASPGGAGSALRPAAPRARLLAHSAAATGCRYSPGWPTVMVTADDAIVSQAPNELEWYGCPRRLGRMRLVCGCARCGRVLLHTPPMLRTLSALPPYADLRKQNVLGIRALPLTRKRERPNDELSMLVEPLTYDEVVELYGVEIFHVDGNEKNNSINTVKEQWTERFPLADVASMAFCPTETNHRRVAVGMHAGFVLIVTV